MSSQVASITSFLKKSKKRVPVIQHQKRKGRCKVMNIKLPILLIFFLRRDKDSATNFIA